MRKSTIEDPAFKSKFVLSNEQIVFCQILKQFLHGESSNVESNIDWNVIKEYADHHQVSAIFYQQTKLKQFQAAFASQVYRSINSKIVIEEFKDAICNMRYIMVKGAVVSDLYQIPALRSMGDIDILIDANDRDNVHKALLNAGFEFVGEAEGEWQYLKRNFIFEIHDSLIHRREGLEKLVEYFSNVWDYVDEEKRCLNWSYHLVYLIEHIRHHFVGRGIGFRQFMDIAIVATKCNIDWDFVAIELKKIKLYEFSTTVFAFINMWFGISIPFEKKIISDEFYVRSTQKIFEDGIFGYNNAENENIEITIRMHYSGDNKRVARVKYLLKKMFPGYESMRNLEYCQYLTNRKILLPFAWIHRIFYIFLSKESRNKACRPLLDDSIDTRIDFLKEWGL